MAVAVALTSWLTVLSWRGLTEAPDGWLGHVLAGGLAVTLTGVGLRWLRVPFILVLLAQLLVAGAWVSAVVAGSPVPMGEAGKDLSRAVRDAQAAIAEFAPPVPDSAASLAPVLLPCALLVLIVVDALAAGLRRVPLAGLALLAAYTVPAGLLGGGLSWLSFLLPALGFLWMLYLQECHSLGRWGRTLDQSIDGTPDTPLHSESFRLTALATAGLTVSAAVLLAAVVPALEPQLFNGNGPGNGDGDVRVDNPMVDLRRDLNRGEDVDLIRVSSDDPDPAYLRISVLTRYTNESWSPGDRTMKSGNDSHGDLPPPEGVNPGLPREEFGYRLEATDAFESTWLPTFQHLVSIEADGDWSFDDTTRDFINNSEDASQIEGLTWSERAVRLDYDVDAMLRAPGGAAQVDATYTALPSSFPREVRELAEEITTQSSSDYESAVRLQRWFQKGGGFVYNTDVRSGTGTDDLQSFLDPDAENGREGYCEQFAAAMAAMTRSLGIPTRIAVGFLRPMKVSPNEYVFSAHDLHAWPEVFIPGSGWVAFEPTPTSHTRALPAYTQADVGPDPTSDASSSSAPTSASSSATSASPSLRPSPTPEAAQQQTDGEETDSPLWPALPLILLALLLTALLLLAPRAVRTARRRRRLAAGDPESAWAELRDSAVDLRLPWPEDTTSRAVGSLLADRVGAVDNDNERPRQGASENPEAVDALHRVALAVERACYARPGSWQPEHLGDDVARVVEGWHWGAPPRSRRTAQWWPRSVLRRRSHAAGAATDSSVQRGVDRVS